jgi:Tfp pilus assembly protein PilX
MIESPQHFGRRGERGSAFAVALLVLLVLTVAGLALTLITQTEVRIGSNERTTTRTLYAADSGIEYSTARNNALGADTQDRVFGLNTTQQDNTAVGTTATTFSDQITVTPLIPLAVQECAFTDIDSKNVCITYVVNSTSQRTGVDKSFSENFASKQLAAMITEMPQSAPSAVNPTAAQIPVTW